MMKLFVGNLSFDVTQDELTSAFAQYGNVERVSIVTHRDTGQPRGFAFVEMSNADEANRAIAGLNGKEVGGRVLTVHDARPPAPQPQRSDRQSSAAMQSGPRRRRFTSATNACARRSDRRAGARPAVQASRWVTVT